MNVQHLLRLTLRNLREDTDEETVQAMREEILEAINQGYGQVMVGRLGRDDAPPLVADTDEPAFDAAYHYILSDYAAYRLLLRGSRQRQERGEAFYASFLTGLYRIAPKTPQKTVHKFGGTA